MACFYGIVFLEHPKDKPLPRAFLPALVQAPWPLGVGSYLLELTHQKESHRRCMYAGGPECLVYLKAKSNTLEVKFIMKNLYIGRRWLLGLLVVLLLAGMLMGCASTSSKYTAQTKSDSLFLESDETHESGFDRGYVRGGFCPGVCGKF